MKSLQNRFLIAFLALVGIACVLWAITHYSGMVVHPYVLAGLRWAAIVAFCGYAFFRRSLTPWIFAGMLVGAEIGYDLTFTSDPTRLKVAADLQILSSIFLRLIKTIIAPLIFSTLVVGIAGHSNLKQVGRMGIKALLYFEIVTTLALFIGLTAIHISKAGAGDKCFVCICEDVTTKDVKRALDVLGRDVLADADEALVARAGFGNVDRRQPDKKRQSGYDLKIQQRFNAHAANLFQVGMPGYPHNQCAKDERSDDGLDQLQKNRAQDLRLGSQFQAGRIAGESEVVTDFCPHQHSGKDPWSKRSANK